MTKDDLKPALDLLIQRSFTDRKSATLEELAAAVGIDSDKPWSNTGVMELVHAMALSPLVASELAPGHDERQYIFRNQCDDAREMLVDYTVNHVQQVVHRELTQVLPAEVVQAVAKGIGNLVHEHVSAHYESTPSGPARIAVPEGWCCPVGPISQRSGASLSVCGASAKRAYRSAYGRITITCTNDHRSDWPFTGWQKG